jgi:Bacterial archaeo-eukaryotic release factor family 3
MIAQDVISHEAVTFDDLKPLATASGPCITMTVPLPNPLEIDVRLKNAIRGAQKKLAEFGVDATHSARLMAPIHEFATTAETNRVWGRAMILFRSPDLFQYYMLRGPVEEVHDVGDHFQVRPLLAAMTHEMRFHLLGLSRRHVRLFQCTQFRAEQEAAHLPQNLDAWLNTRQPDHVLDNRAVAGPSSGKKKGIMFGTSTDRERDPEYVAHFLAAVEKEVTAHLHKDPAPLVLAGVEYELAIYQRLNSYQRTLEQSVQGSPDGMTNQALHERAMQVVLQSPSEPLKQALEDIRTHAGTNRVATDKPAAIQAARLGHVLDFLIAEGAESWGVWNAETPGVTSGSKREELLNAAALQTLRHGGRAFVVKAPDMPVPAEVAAFLRF